MMKAEKELFLPTRLYFEKQGFSVDGEVKNCDLVAIKNDIVVVAELKKTFNISLVYQLMERKNSTPYVYAVIFRPKNFREKKTKQMLKLIKLLGVGLLVVSDTSGIIEEIVTPNNDNTGIKVNTEKRNTVSKEFNKRDFKENTGGVNRKKILTAYRENSIAALCVADTYGVVETRKVKDNIKKAVQSNYYDWFYRIKKGIYGTTEKGIQAIKSNDFQEVVLFYKSEVEKCLK